jgi:hypothetical protein
VDTRRQSNSYNPPTLARFLVFAIPLLLLAMAGFTFGLETLDLAPDTSALAPWGLGRSAAPPASLTLVAWLVEAVALAALFLLVQGRGGRWWIDGALTGALAWVFRGPLLVSTISTLTLLPRQPFAEWARGALVLDLLCGLLLAGLARLLRLER